MSKIITLLAVLSTLATAGCDDLGIPSRPGARDQVADVPVCLDLDGCPKSDIENDFKQP